MSNTTLAIEINAVTVGIAIAVFIIGVLIGWLVAWVRQQAVVNRLTAELYAAKTRHDDYLSSLEHRFAALSDDALASNSKTFLDLARLNFARFQEQTRSDREMGEQQFRGLVEPLEDALYRSDQQIRQFEQQRQATTSQLGEQLRSLGEEHHRLRQQTQQLTQALRRPEVRGRWGETTLHRLLELSGLQQHVDFSEQVTTKSGDSQSSQRPDCVIHLPSGRDIVIDAKTTLDAYLDAVSTDNETERRNHLKRHANQLRNQIRKLSDKQYWRDFELSVDFVIVFLPGEHLLTDAMDVDSTLLDEALKMRVIPATPLSLVALLRSIAFGWRQDKLVNSAREIQRAGQQLLEHLSTINTDLDSLGRGLNTAVNQYNRLGEAMQRDVLQSMNTLVELGIDSTVPKAGPRHAPPPVVRRDSSAANRSSPSVPS